MSPRASRMPPPDAYALQPGEPPVYSGPEVILAPPQMIVIEPAEPDVVYVPTYDPGVVYGEPLPVYPGYSYEPPQPLYSTGAVVTDGVISFGVGIVVGSVISHYDWGWNSWGVHWGGDRWHGRDDDRGRRNREPDAGGWHRPAVVYNNSTYVSRSTTIVNRVTNNYNNNNSINTRNIINFGPGGNNRAPVNAGPLAPPAGLANGNNPARPNFNNMTKPDFSHVAPGAGTDLQQPNVHQANPAEMPRPRPNQGQRPEDKLQNRPFGGAQVRPEMTRPPMGSGAPGAVHPEQRPPLQARERPQPQPRPPVQVQERPQPRPQMQPQPGPQAQAPQNHPQAHDGGGHPHPDKKDQAKHE